MQKSFYEIALKLNTDKVNHHRYDRFYPIFLEKLRNKSFGMCEIGTWNCEGIKLWKEYFPFAKIFSVDIEDKSFCNSENVTTIKADQSNFDGITKISNHIGLCEFIIDDGSHVPEHQYNTFKILFKNNLSYGGIYIIEDIESSYWNENSKIYDYKVGNKKIFSYFNNIYNEINSEFSKENNELNISTITYAHNCIIITKRTIEEIDLLKRTYRFESRL